MRDKPDPLELDVALYDSTGQPVTHDEVDRAIQRATSPQHHHAFSPPLGPDRGHVLRRSCRSLKIHADTSSGEIVALQVKRLLQS